MKKTKHLSHQKAQRKRNKHLARRAWRKDQVKLERIQAQNRMIKMMKHQKAIAEKTPLPEPAIVKELQNRTDLDGPTPEQQATVIATEMPNADYSKRFEAAMQGDPIK